MGVLRGSWFRREPLSNVTPFTYRDGWTMLQLVEDIRKKLIETVKVVRAVVDQVNGFDAELEAIVEQVDAKLAAQAEANATALAIFRQEMLDLIVESVAAGVIRNPTNGRIEPVEKVVNNVYDYARVHALFVKNVEDANLTVGQLDVRAWTARHFDLSPTAVTNATLESDVA